jgi:hypothetical protein
MTYTSSSRVWQPSTSVAGIAGIGVTVSSTNDDSIDGRHGAPTPKSGWSVVAFWMSMPAVGPSTVPL